MNKQKNAVTAKLHTKEMKHAYADEIAKCAKETIRYKKIDESIIINKKHATVVEINPVDTVSEIFSQCKDNKDKVAALNFASYKNPGGGFLYGSNAQEECLCHESILYNVLTSSECEEYYTEHMNTQNLSLYYSDILYSPKVLFIRDDTKCSCDIITCAAPNANAYLKKECTREAYIKLGVTMMERIDYILTVAAIQEVDTLILGAFGCGAFGNDPNIVAHLFKNLIETKYDGCFKKIIFAIPLSDRVHNYSIFSDIFIGHHNNWNNSMLVKEELSMVIKRMNGIL